MLQDASRWALLYNQTPLCDVPRHFAGMRQSPFLLQYLTTVLSLCPLGGRTLETGVGSGYGAIWLSLRGVQASGIDYSPAIVERARQVNNVLGGNARFASGDLFDLYREDTPRYHVIHHQGVLEHFTAVKIRAALAQQVAMADRVVFSVPSVHYPFDPEFGDERLLPLEEWRRLLAPFDIEELRYYGDPQWGEREHVLAVLRGQPVSERLLSLMTIPAEPYPAGITAIVHTRNEAHNIGDCLQTLPWADEILVCDMESEDATVEIARQYTDKIILHPRISNFDRARNVSAMAAQFRWIFFLDADERVPAGLGPALRKLALENEQDDPGFAGLLVPFRHHFAGRWMRCLYPGYTAPRLLKNGHFLFNARLHSGAQVDGKTQLFPADNPDLALEHHSFESLSHYLDKLNRYTDGEATNMHRDGQPYHWQQAIRHFVQDFQSYYDQGQAGAKDGVHGFLYSFLSAFYRWEQHAKLYEKRFREGRLTPGEQAVPRSVAEVLQFALSVATEPPPLQTPAIRVVEAGTTDAAKAANIVWSGPLYDPSGYGEESRNFVFALEEACVQVAAQSLPWSHDESLLTADELERMRSCERRSVLPGFVQIVQNFPSGFTRHPQAQLAIGRTMFETDRLPVPWVQACNQMDALWVPSEFNRRTFTDAGVAPEKLVVIPGCFDPTPYQQPAIPTTLTEEIRNGSPFVFLTVFDWTRHKGWDVLLSAFLHAFEGREDVSLVLKVWSTMGYNAQSLKAQAQEYVRQTLGHDLITDRRIRFVTERLSRADLLSLYLAGDAFVLPSRGEGWGRPYMEAMACGLPTIGTNWSGNTAFMNAENSYLLNYDVVPVPEAGWREIPTYQGHRWAEPDEKHLIELLRRVAEERSESTARGERAREEVTAKYNRETVGRQMAAELARLTEILHPHPLSAPSMTSTDSIAEASVNTGQSKTESVITESANGSSTEASPVEAVRDATESNGTGSESTVPGKAADRIAVRWEGAPFVWHSLAHVNRAFCLGLLGSGRVDLSLVPTEPTHFDPRQEPRFAPLAPLAFAPLKRPADIHVRHFFPPRLDAPDEGKFVLIQPWEYGYLPNRWIEPIRNNVDEVWCYSQYVKEVYLASGIPEQKLQIVPLGVDTEVFTPTAPPYVFTTEPGVARIQAEGGLAGRFVFLFLGGTLQRKGIDILLEAYLKAFSAYDDVCLVIKDTGTQTVYRGANERERILALAADTSRPPILYLEPDLTPHQLAGVYSACDCLVQPYRGEGFCLPALEAMSCGLPVVVPAGGPTDDFVDDTVGWRLPAERKPFGASKIGEWDCVGPTWMFEVSPVDLGRKMRQILNDREGLKRKGTAARAKAATDWTWERACEIALKRMDVLRSLPARKPLVSTAPKQEKKRDQREELAEVLGTDRRAVVRAASPRKRPTISLCMIVKNEERVLGDCLRTAKPHVDEIILVDTGSTDRTVEIALEHGAKVFHFPWCDDFSAARNVSLEHATGDWLFWMDADDTIPEECGNKLRELVWLAEDRVTGFLMQVHIPPAPGENGFTVVDHVKLFRNLPGMRFEGRIHEQILEPLYRLGGTVERTNLFVVHSGYDYSPEGQARKRERDLTILAKELEERPFNPFVHFNIGMTHHHLKNYDLAIPALRRSLELSKPYESTVRKVYAMLAGCHLDKGETAEAKEWLDKGLALFPADPELLFRGGNVYKEAGDIATAERCLTQVLANRETGHIDSIDVSMTGYKARHNLAVLYQETGRYVEAETQWRAALSENPGFVPSWLGLAELFMLTRRFEDARQVAHKIVETDAEQANRLLSRLEGLR